MMLKSGDSMSGRRIGSGFNKSLIYHSFSVAHYSRLLCNALHFSRTEVTNLYIAAIFHDIGKICISNEILKKPGKLTNKEWAIIKRHPLYAERILIRVPFSRNISKPVRHHHERFDGTGYPDGLRGEEIPLYSRILALADAFAAMTSDRCYRTALPVQKALAELVRCSGSQFDPLLAEAFIKTIQDKKHLLTGESIISEKALQGSDHNDTKIGE